MCLKAVASVVAAAAAGPCLGARGRGAGGLTARSESACWVFAHFNGFNMKINSHTHAHPLIVCVCVRVICAHNNESWPGSLELPAAALS